MELIERHRASVAPMLAFDTDIIAQQADGIWVEDADGNRWADFACGTAVTNLGHNHPAVVEAAHTQLDKFVHSGCIFRYEGIVDLAESLQEITPEGIDKFGFANSGAEAVEASVKLAKYTTKRQGVVAFRGAFHGRTLGSVAYTTSNAKYRDGYHPILGSVFVAPFPHPYRWAMSEEAATERSLDELRLMLKHEVRPNNIAAFLVEPVQGEGGYYPAPPKFLQELRNIANEYGIALVFDEVQTGFGRTASWFASDHFDVNPDIIAMGKGIANGFPLSAYGASSDVVDGWPVGAHGTTFGGNPVACAAAGAVIETMGGLFDHARQLSGRAFERFNKMAESSRVVGDVRGLGLMIGIELVKDPDTREPDAGAMQHISRHGLANELIIIGCGPDGNVIRFIPPLVATMDDLERAIDVIEEAVEDYES